MKTKTQKPKLKARRMWANYYSSERTIWARSKKSTAMKCGVGYGCTHKAIPVAVIPLDDVPGLVRTAGDAFAASYDGHLCKSDIVAMLTSIGVLPRAKKGGRK